MNADDLVRISRTSSNEVVELEGQKEVGHEEEIGWDSKHEGCEW